jgi:hypothetical protein
MVEKVGHSVEVSFDPLPERVQARERRWSLWEPVVVAIITNA